MPDRQYTHDGAPGVEELWRLTLLHSPVGMCLVDLDGRLTVVNRALCEMLGYDASRLLALRFQDITHPDDLDADLRLYEQVLAGELESYRLRKRYLRADGEVLWVDLSVALARGRDGAPAHFVSQVLDVSDQVEAERREADARAELEAERQTLEAIFETVSVGLLLIDRDGRYLRMNRRHAETMSLPFPDGHDGEAGQLGHVYHADGQTLMQREEMPSYRAVNGEEFDDLRYWVGRDAATRRAFATSARTVRAADGTVTGAALAYQEITDLMRAMQVKDEFVASVSHELRTPLTAVLGYLELLEDVDDVPGEARTLLDVVERNARRLRSLVGDLLQVAQASEGVLELYRDEVDLTVLVEEAVEAARPHADRAGISLDSTVPPSLVATVDGQRVRQVLDNLVSNAIKYTEAGGSVRVEVQAPGTEAEIVVSDTGLGMDASELEQVGTRFFRGGEALQRHIPGTGLGLNIVRAIVTAHGGSVDVRSEVGVGTTFRVVLPVASAR